MPEKTQQNLASPVKMSTIKKACSHMVSLKSTLLPRQVTPKDRLSHIQSLRAQVTFNIITAEDIDNAIDEGRA